MVGVAGRAACVGGCGCGRECASGAARVDGRPADYSAGWKLTEYGSRAWVLSAAKEIIDQRAPYRPIPLDPGALGVETPGRQNAAEVRGIGRLMFMCDQLAEQRGRFGQLFG